MTRAANHVGKGITMRTTLKSLRLAIATSMLAILALIAPTQPAQATQQCIGTTTNGHGGSSFDGDCVFMNVCTAYDAASSFSTGAIATSTSTNCVGRAPAEPRLRASCEAAAGPEAGGH